MNEFQHDKLVARDHAQYDVTRARDKLEIVVGVLKVREEELQRAVDADKASWYGTPTLGVQR